MEEKNNDQSKVDVTGSQLIIHPTSKYKPQLK